MAIYKLPDDPRTPLYDKANTQWLPDPRSKNRYTQDIPGATLCKTKTWAELMAQHSPLTTQKPRQIGDQIHTLNELRTQVIAGTILVDKNGKPYQVPEITYGLNDKTFKHRLPMKIIFTPEN